ncbi:hypothetical protein BC941DRAFT_395661, partial [Chlamydoabsidia padenii]
MIPGYSIHTESEGGDIWCGSGKTLFLKQLVLRLEERGQEFNLALVCYDLNMETFLLDLFKKDYPATRLNTIIQGYWQKQYGVVLCIRKKHSKQQPVHKQQSSFTNKVHLVISTDLRILHNNPAISILENADSNNTNRPPVLILTTMQSVEERLIRYTLSNSSNSTSATWQLPDPSIYPMIFDTKNDIPVKNSKAMTTMVVDKVMRWIENDITQPFLLPDIQHEEQSSQPPSEPTPRQQPLEVADSDMMTTDDASVPEPLTSSDMDVDHEEQGNTIQDNTVPLIMQQPITTSQHVLPKEDLIELFSHVSLDQLNNNLKSYQASHGRSSKEHFTSTSDDDSFYSAESESSPDDPTAASVNQVMEKLYANHQGKQTNLDSLKKKWLISSFLSLFFFFFF